MTITKDSVPHCGTTEKNTSEEEVCQRAMAENSKEFVEAGAEVSAKA